MPSSPLKILDLFAGCGGFSLGFEKEGYKVILANEVWEPAIQTYRRNFPNTIMIEGDIREKHVQKQIIEHAKMEEIDVIIGGPPCQSYSTDGNRNPNDPRATLFEEYLKILKMVRPKFFLMENVKGITSMKALRDDLDPTEQRVARELFSRIQRYKDLKRYGAQRELNADEEAEFEDLKQQYHELKKQGERYLMPLTEKIRKKIEDLGYRVQFQVLNSVDYGSPQVRQRAFFFGTFLPNIELEFPKPNGTTHKTPKEVLDDLKNLPEHAVQAHVFTKHSKKYLEKIKRTPPGGRIYKNYSSAHVRLHPDRPSPTVKENHGGVFIHYEKERALTPRELARLQDFNDEFVFEGVKRDILKQIGNAVPINLSRAWAVHVTVNSNNV
ncbi:MAG: DNA (cytosine-5-)-methyltransferase [Candidatus Helarchaeota archaeon]